MGFPSTSLATLRPDILNGLMEFDLAMDRQGFIGLKVLPVFETQLEAGTFGRIPLEQLLQNRNTDRAADGGYSRGTWEFLPNTYATQEHGAEEPISDKEAKMYQYYFDFEMVCAARAYDAVLRSMEQRIAAQVFNPALVGGAQAYPVDIPWTTENQETADAIFDVNAAVVAAWENSGIWPNALAINRKKYRDVRQQQAIRENVMARGAGDRIRAADIGPAMLAMVFDLDYVFVAGGAQNMANEGQDRAISQIWPDDYCWVGRVARTNDMREPCIGRTMHWGADGSSIGGTIETYREERIRGDVVRVRNQTEEKIIYQEMGMLITGINASGTGSGSGE